MELFKTLDKNTKIFLIIKSIFVIIAIIMQFYLINFYGNTLPFYITIPSVLILIVYFVLSIKNITITKKFELTKQDLEQTKLYNKTLNNLYDNVRCFKHDFHNIVQAIGGYVDTNDTDGLKKYYKQIVGDCQKSNNLSILNPDTINNPAIYNIIACKYYKAETFGITINFEITLDLNYLRIKIYELTRILGILVDNAIEACSECEEKIINIIMRNEENKNRQLIIIENTYSNKNIDTEKIYEKAYSTKPNNSGLGLWEVRKILNKNNNLNLFTTKDSEFFKQQLEIY